MLDTGEDSTGVDDGKGIIVGEDKPDPRGIVGEDEPDPRIVGEVVVTVVVVVRSVRIGGRVTSGAAVASRGFLCVMVCCCCVDTACVW